MTVNVPVLYVDPLGDHLVARGQLPNGTRYKAVAGSMDRLRERVAADLRWEGYDSWALITTQLNVAP